MTLRRNSCRLCCGRRHRCRLRRSILFVIFPAIDGFPLLFGTLAPAFLAMGYLQANPRHTLKALALLIGVIGALDLQPRFLADFASFANVNAAEVVGIIASFLAMRMFRSFGADRMARRRSRRSWRDVAKLADARAPVDRDSWLSPMLDRFGLLISRPSPAGPNPEARKVFVAIQVGLDLIDLMIAQDTVGVARGAASEIALQRVIQLCRTFAEGHSFERSATAGVLAAIDSALREIVTQRHDRRRHKALWRSLGSAEPSFQKRHPLIPEKFS